MSWPPSALSLRTPDVELRGLDQSLAEQLGAVLPDDVEVHPDLALLGTPREQHVVQGWCREVATWSTADWVLSFAVLRDGEPVGVQGLEGRRFAEERTVDTYSWLVAAERGGGLGRHVRAAVLTFAAEQLGALRAVTEAWTTNTASLAVSRALGYRDTHVEQRPDGRMQHLALDLTDLRVRPLLHASRLEAVRPLLGLPAG